MPGLNPQTAGREPSRARDVLDLPALDLRPGPYLSRHVDGHGCSRPRQYSSGRLQMREFAGRCKDGRTKFDEAGSTSLDCEFAESLRLTGCLVPVGGTTKRPGIPWTSAFVKRRAVGSEAGLGSASSMRSNATEAEPDAGGGLAQGASISQSRPRRDGPRRRVQESVSDALQRQPNRPRRGRGLRLRAARSRPRPRADDRVIRLPAAAASTVSSPARPAFPSPGPAESPARPAARLVASPD